MSFSRNLIFIVIAIVVILFDSIGLLGTFHSASNTVVFPIKKFVWNTALTLKQIPGNIRNVAIVDTLSEENRDLKRKDNENTLNLEILQDENRLLRLQLESPLPPTYKFIAAPVLGISKTMDITSGERDGVKVGMPVVAGTTLIGKIGEVTSERSSVFLLRDSDLRIIAKTNNDTRGEIGGLLGESIKMDKILQKDLTLIGDLVTTSGEDGLPPNLIIGKITRVQSDDVSVYKKAEVEPDVDPSVLKIVFVISSQ